VEQTLESVWWLVFGPVKSEHAPSASMQAPRSEISRGEMVVFIVRSM